MRSPWSLVAVVALATALTGCTQASQPPAAEDVAPTAETTEHYVAMGDSYTAAPLVPLRGEATGCLRSQDNYPNLIAQEIDGVDVVDVSCSGASTVSMYNRQDFDDISHPPQLDALTSETDLVTLGIGANDYRFFTQMMIECLEVADRDPSGSPCRELNATRRGQDQLSTRLDLIRERVGDVVTDVRERAPEARVLLVGYPQLLPDEGACRGRLPLARGDYDYAKGLNLSLADAVRDGGLEAGAEYVDLIEASEGHDICSDEPWIAGIRDDPFRAFGLHPYPAEQRAVADLVLEML